MEPTGGEPLDESESHGAFERVFEVNHVLTQIHQALRQGDGESSRRVRSAREFASILNRERDRTDRTGQEFSLVVFETGDGSRRSATVRNFVAILAQRIRPTDDIGWLEDGRIAAALPHTVPDGAWKFVENVRRALDESAPAPDCTVYTYPSRWITRTGGESSQAGASDKPAPSQPGIPFPKMKHSTVESGDPAQPLEALGPHFLQPIPFWKRAIDVLGSLAAMILLSPLALMVALLIMIVSPGPLFFRQERVGYLGRRFTLWKFRTMHVNADTAVHQKHLRELMASGKEMTKLDNDKDQRIIPFGSILRATGLDELPQLVNVLLGEMSLVGPRPCLSYEARRVPPLADAAVRRGPGPHRPVAGEREEPDDVPGDDGAGRPLREEAGAPARRDDLPEDRPRDRRPDHGPAFVGSRPREMASHRPSHLLAGLRIFHAEYAYAP